jgi:uncharacterized membrane protein (UPF0127 family)
MRPALVRRFALLWTLLFATLAAAQNPEVTLSIAGQKLRAEVAATHDSRMQGLMYREQLPENRGMLFVYPEAETQQMWMLNTLVPLSVAFIGRDGRILNIRDMEPQTIDAHPSNGAAAYSLEMNRGWFAKRGIGPGARVEGLEAAPPPE